MSLSERFPHYWICATCAVERGGVWPERHVATMLLTECEYCGGANQEEDEGAAPWTDYNWPKDAKSDKTAKLNRD
jgi:hypothetical protein